MITKEQFTNIIESYNKFDEFCDQQHKLGVDLIESDLFNAVGILFDNAIYSNFIEEASDFIMWWMFESVNKEIEVDGKTINLETIDNLWQYLISCGYVLE